MLKKAPIILFVYNRPQHTRVTVESLLNNHESAYSTLFVFSDGPKSLNDQQKHYEDGNRVTEVRKYIRSIRGFRDIEMFENETNKGLAESVISGVSTVFQEYDKVIVVEDDLVLASIFLRFMNEALEFYRNDSRIFSLGGYSPNIAMPIGYKDDVYLSYRCSSWGWATWKDRWEKADWNVEDYCLFKKDRKMQQAFSRGGRDLVDILAAQMNHKINSWAIRWDYAHFRNNACALKPRFSLVRNIGTDGSGNHSSVTDHYNVDITLFRDRTPLLRSDVEINRVIAKRLAAFYERRQRPFMKRLRAFIARLCQIKNVVQDKYPY